MIYWSANQREHDRDWQRFAVRLNTQRNWSGVKDARMHTAVTFREGKESVDENVT